jgi:hypothetical protein
MDYFENQLVNGIVMPKMAPWTPELSMSVLKSSKGVVFVLDSVGSLTHVFA